MKKLIPYCIALCILILIALVWGERTKTFNQRITFNRKDKIPYGSFVAFENLKYFFPGAKIILNKRAPGEWDDSILDLSGTHQVLIAITREFNADNEELTSLFHFAEAGNDVLISSNLFSRDAEEFFHFTSTTNDYQFNEPYENQPEDTLRLRLSRPPFETDSQTFVYPGRKFGGYFESFDSSMSYVLGRSMELIYPFGRKPRLDSLPNLLRLRAGKGNFFIHAAPMAFSNYFLLYRNNMAYYNELLSLLDGSAMKVAWDEYFIHKPKFRGKPSSPFRILLEQPAFAWALYLALAGVLIYVILGLKRRQRMIPVVDPPRNDSLDFVKTVGRLYYEKKDNKNLCTKMGNYFTEYVHNKYHLHTGTLDEAFCLALIQKSGCEEKTMRKIINYINFIQDAPAIHDQQLIEFYELLSTFYKTS